MTDRGKVSLLLLLLLIAFPIIDGLPDQLAMARLAGLSLLWWYGGVAAPLSAWIVALAWLPDDRPPDRHPE